MAFDRNELTAIPPADITAYLTEHGWRRDGTQGPAEVWSVTVSSIDVTVLIPASAKLRGYPVRVAEVVRTLAEVEERSDEEVLHDLREVHVDMQEVRLLTGGTVPLHDGYVALRGVHDLLLAAASAAILGDTRPVLPARRPPAAWWFLRGVRLAQTGAVLRVETPLDPTGPVSSRDVLVQLHHAVRTAHEVAEGDAQLDLGEHTAAGVTADLCAALADIGGTRRTPFTIAFTWAPSVPMTTDTPPLRFDRHRITRLTEAAEHLRAVRVADAARLEGLVVELRRDAAEEDGMVVVDGVVSAGGRERHDRVTVRLPRHAYETAMRAHRSAATVVVHGRLVDTGDGPALTGAGPLTVHGP